jgi:hypothetical protein
MSIQLPKESRDYLRGCPSVVSQKYDYIVVRVFGRSSLPWLSMRRGGSVGCSFQ